MKIRTLIISIGLIFSSISFHAQIIDWENKIIGKWTLSDANEKESVFYKTEEFEKNKPGFVFLENGDFIHYSFFGWCATPPLQYSSHKGSWVKIHDEILEIKFKNLDGINHSKIFIKYVSNDKLVIQMLNKKIEK